MPHPLLLSAYLAMKLAETNDAALIESIICAPDIAPFVLEDGQAFSYVEGPIYLTNGADVLFVLMQRFSKVVEVHTCIRSHVKRKIEYAYDVLEWVRNSQFDKMQTQVPEHLLHVRAFVNQVGFTHEGIQRKAFVNGGIARDLHLYGMTRQEIEVKLCQLQR